MGAHPYWYFVPFNPDVEVALQELRQREFAAGRYNPVIPFLDFPLGPNPPAPGPKHASIEEALASCDADGTRSILDIDGIGDEPDFGIAARMSDDDMESCFGTTKPTRRMVEEKMDFMEGLERGHCVYILVYENGKPAEIFFAGYSFD